MGRKFGAIGRLKNVVTYSLSPFEQRAFAGFQKSLANFVRRVRWQLPYQIPPVIIGVLIYNWGTNDFIRRNRKNPKDYENDVWTLFFNYLGFHYLFVTFCLIHSTVLGAHPQSPSRCLTTLLCWNWFVIQSCLHFMYLNFEWVVYFPRFKIFFGWCLWIIANMSDIRVRLWLNDYIESVVVRHWSSLSLQVKLRFC